MSHSENLILPHENFSPSVGVNLVYKLTFWKIYSKTFINAQRWWGSKSKINQMQQTKLG
jgi:hypothetical protein